MNNNRIKYIIICISALSMFSCDNFLKEDSADLLIPTTMEDYAPILRGEGYPKRFTSQIGFVDLMTDDVEMGPLYYDPIQTGDRFYKKSKWREGADPNIGYGEFAHRWERDYSDHLADNFWAGRYSNILACNSIIDALPTMTYAETEVAQYRKLAAQAYALRAYHYFCLINTYALPYSQENLDKPGVILRTAPNIEIGATGRSTIKEIYTLVNEDIKKAQEYIIGADLQNFKYEISEEAIYFLACRIALFQNHWDGVIEAGKKFLTKNKYIFDLSTVNQTYVGLPETYKNELFANDINSEEVVFAFGDSDKSGNVTPYMSPWLWYAPYEFGFHPSWDGANALINTYDEDDLRLKYYFTNRCYKDPTSTRFNPEYVAGQYRPLKCDPQASLDFYPQAWRTPEVYLSLAEAYAQKTDGISTDAIALINQLRLKKYAANSPNAEKNRSDFSTKEELVNFIWQERRRELCFEEIMRFWDLRRQGMPEIKHKVYDTKTTYKSYTLPQGSPNYVLPIPNDEIAHNNGIVNNQRIEIGESSEK